MRRAPMGNVIKTVLAALAALSLVACAADAKDDSANSTAAATDGTATAAETKQTVLFGCGGYLRRDPAKKLDAATPARDFVAADRHAAPLTADLEPLFAKAVAAQILRDSSEGFYGSDGQQIDDESLKLVTLVGDFGIALQQKYCKAGQQIGSLQVVDGAVPKDEAIELFSDKNANEGAHESKPNPALVEDDSGER